MRDVVVILSSENSLHNIERWLHKSKFEIIGPAEGRLIVSWQGQEVQFHQNQALSNHYDEPEELSLLASVGLTQNFFLANFKEVKFLSEVLAFVVNQQNSLIDNDFDRIESGPEFLRRFEENPDWDWLN
ncbi:hypothetical protein [Eleftheria terrae]|uniref:hypothetical protein n=1 Tax=Eleftheria terrae TaxID=1597781 RepID=UPI00263A8BBB|nr:hypothetical protein [Eleftheria terrae]WKB56039.1 hypothetical protein N7L95_28675 [Eleftheria terrae]